jgi:hypothetical protein
MEVGRTYVWEYWKYRDDGSFDGPHRYERALIAAGFPYTAPQGTFDDCVLIRTDDYDQGVFESLWYEILANGIGEVLSLSADAPSWNPDLDLYWHLP